MLLFIGFLRLGNSLVALDLMSDDHVTGYAALFWWKNTKNYNLLLAKRKVLNTFITKRFLGSRNLQEKSKLLSNDHITDRSPFLAGKYENTIIYLKLTKTM